ncbi:MAG: hypothetical protein QM572_16795 [Nocardioides sp.]|uniref:hypothetical protein n=1 Tax=Nocardioides sp. TaxID=35761 RepID=UPI0039E3633C
MSRRDRTFAEIAAEAKAAPKHERTVRPGGFNVNGELFDPSGHLLSRIGEVSPKRAQELVADGALVAFEGCGCGGSVGCETEWIEPGVLGILASSRPRFVKGHGSPTWIDLWEGDAGLALYAHGDVEWGGLLA